MDIKSLMKSIENNPYMTIMDDMKETPGYLDTGSYMLNALVSGSIFKGFPLGKISILAGQEQVGKSYVLLDTAKRFLENDPKAVVVFFETEGAIDKQIAVDRGLDTTRILYVPVVTVQEFQSQALQILEGYLNTPEAERIPMLLMLDSLGMLSTSAELLNTVQGKETRDLTRAQIIKATFRVLTLKLTRAKVALLCTNHTYDQIGAMTKPGMPTPQQMSGGSGGKYSASTIVFLSRKKTYDESTKEYVGNIIHCKLVKSRFTKPDRQIDIDLSYTKGVNPYYGLLDLAKEHNILPFSAGKFEMPDGKKFYAKQIYNDPNRWFTPELMNRLDEAAAKEFTYGTGNEGDSVDTAMTDDE